MIVINNRDYNIDQNNRDYDFGHNRAALLSNALLDRSVSFSGWPFLSAGLLWHHIFSI